MAELGSEAGTNHFDNKFQVDSMTIFDGTVQSVEIKPKIQSEKSRIPILFAPGWSETLPLNKGPLRVLVDQGRHVLSFSHIRRGGEQIDEAYQELVGRIGSRLSQQGNTDPDSVLAGINERWHEVSQEFPPGELRRALTILGFLEEKNIDKVDAVSHSSGGIDVIVAAYLYPDKFRNIVPIDTKFTRKNILITTLVAGINQAKYDNSYHNPLPMRTGAIISEEAEAKYREIEQANGQLAEDRLSSDEILKEQIKYVKANPGRALGSELRAIAGSQITGLLTELRKQGIDIVPIHAIDDKNFPSDKLQKAHTLSSKEDGTGNVDGFVTVRGGHNTFDKDARILLLADRLLTQLGNKHSAPDAA